ncbi:MAG TPA: carbonic anhydrase family protein [Anaerolineae bacterium]|nr:carbonic anhydrase family protein [Anaerolineae bacterium]
MNVRSRNPLLLLILALPVGLFGCVQPAEPEPTAAATEAAAVVTLPEPTLEVAAAHSEVHWTYEGAEGPGHWADLAEGNEACGSGKAQSPIDLAGYAGEDLADITFSYLPTKTNVVNNGHTIQFNYDEGNTIEIDGTTYNLLQMHFHAPSEHSVDGKLADAEMHLVHKSADGGLAVVGVLINKGAENATFNGIWSHLPAEVEEVGIDAGLVMADELLPAVRATYRYDGSLTTPPCTEGVKWNVMTTPIEMSEAQLAAFSEIVDPNNRPVQPLGDRALVEDTTP